MRRRLRQSGAELTGTPQPAPRLDGDDESLHLSTLILNDWFPKLVDVNERMNGSRRAAFPF